MMRLKELEIREKEQQRRIIKEKLEALFGIIPSLKAMEVGLNFQTEIRRLIWF